MSRNIQKRSLGLIHTVGALAPTFTALVREHLPEWEPFSIVDESLLRNTIRAGTLELTTIRRLVGHVWSTEAAGADAILVTCSSIGPAVDAARPLCGVPLVRVDTGMVEEALAKGDGRIGVLATLSTTLTPTAELVVARAAMRRADVSVESQLCEGAFEALSTGDRDTHDAKIRDGLRAIADKVEIVVLAQASMADAIDDETRRSVGIPVLSSPELGVGHLKLTLEEHAAASSGTR